MRRFSLAWNRRGAPSHASRYIGGRHGRRMHPIARPSQRSRGRASLGALAVEMEAAALYAFSATSGHSIVCFAHVTNSMALTEGDFEKGEADGAKATLAIVAATAGAWRS